MFHLVVDCPVLPFELWWYSTRQPSIDFVAPIPTFVAPIPTFVAPAIIFVPIFTELIPAFADAEYISSILFINTLHNTSLSKISKYLSKNQVLVVVWAPRGE